MVMWVYVSCVIYRDAVNRAGTSSGTPNTVLLWDLIYGEFQTHGDLAKKNQARWETTTKITLVLNCDPLNYFLLELTM